jgi:hypothetical protein
VKDGLLARIARKAGVPELVEALTERLSASELQSLLLAVYERRARAGTPGELARRYAENRFVRPSSTSPDAFAAFDRLAYALLPEGFEPLELSPVAPFGASSIVAGVSQNRIVTTSRNTEVAADLTNAMALECAHRRALSRRSTTGRSDPTARVKLAASQRLVRAQPQMSPAQLPHFRLFALCTAGRDEGAFRFETAALFEHADFYLRLLAALRNEGRAIGAVRVPVTPLPDGPSAAALEREVVGPLVRAHPAVRVHLAPEREQGRGYYTGVCFHVQVADGKGEEWQLADGGLTTWTQQLASDDKERLYISGFGTERVLGFG